MIKDIALTRLYKDPYFESTIDIMFERQVCLKLI